MPKADDPFYNRKPVPDEFIKDVGITGLTVQDEHYNRERKYSDQKGVDVRRFSFSNKSGWKPQSDPYYGRKPVSKPEIDGIGDTGLTPDEEYLSRERKYSVNGVDVRRFSTSRNSGMEPQDDPYYGRKPVSSALTKGIGETGMTPAETYEVRERKQSVVNFSGDPFQQLTGAGHRQSISSGHVAGAAAAATRRRSSAAPNGLPAAQGQHHSGYDGDKTLAPIESRPELPPVKGVGGMEEGSSSTANGGPHETSTTTPAHNITTVPQHPHHFDDPDSVAPDETR